MANWDDLFSSGGGGGGNAVNQVITGDIPVSNLMATVTFQAVKDQSKTIVILNSTSPSNFAGETDTIWQFQNDSTITIERGTAGALICSYTIQVIGELA